jgi:hypothetical protein
MNSQELSELMRNFKGTVQTVPAGKRAIKAVADNRLYHGKLSKDGKMKWDDPTQSWQDAVLFDNYYE